jgi:gluconate transporter
MPALWIILALALLLVLILRYHFNAFVAMLLAGLALGLIAGLSPGETLTAVKKGIGDILREVALLIVLGSLLGKMLEVSGAAEAIAGKLLAAFGEDNASFAILVTGLIVGIPVIFGVGFLLLIPIVYRLQRQTERSLLWFLLPLGFSLGIMHSLVPPKPGIVAAVRTLGGANPNQTMIHTIIFGVLLSIPVTFAGWFGPGRFWARREFIPAPEQLPGGAGDTNKQGSPAPFALSLAIVLLPLLLSLLGFAIELLDRLNHLPAWISEPIAFEFGEGFILNLHSVLAWLRFLGTPETAMLIPTGLAFWLLGARRGLGKRQLGKVAGEAIQEVAAIALLFGAAGGFKEVIQATGSDALVKDLASHLPLPPLATAFLVSALIRIALGSATAAILTASAILVGFVPLFEGRETLLVLAVANGVTFMTQPADSGFWMLKEYGNLSVRDVFVKYNACRIFMSLLGLLILLVCEQIFSPP